MAKLDFEHFLDKEMTRIYLAGELKEATRVENTLTRQGIDYAVEIESYCKFILGIFPAIYKGAGFYVLSREAASARSILLAAGLDAGIESEEFG